MTLNHSPPRPAATQRHRTKPATRSWSRRATSPRPDGPVSSDVGPEWTDDRVPRNAVERRHKRQLKVVCAVLVGWIGHPAVARESWRPGTPSRLG